MEKLTFKDVLLCLCPTLSIVSFLLACVNNPIWFIAMLIFASIAKSNKDYYDQFTERDLSAPVLKRALGSRGGDKI